MGPIRRLRRRQRVREWFSDIDLKPGDRIRVTIPNVVTIEGKVVDLYCQVGAERRFALLDNGIHVRVGAPPVVGAPRWVKL